MLDASSSTFSHGKLTKILRKPSNTSLQVLKCQIYDHAAFPPSRHGGGAYYHIGIVLDTAQYMAVFHNIPWITP
jgi:hypothetical protein